EYPLLRGIVPWLRDSEQDMVQASKARRFLAGSFVGQLLWELFDRVWGQAELDKADLFARNKAQLKGEAETALFETRMGNLPRELLDMIWNEAERDLLESVEAWFADILNELVPYGLGYRYSPAEVAEMSGGLVDAWMVEQLRGVARASWQARVTDQGQLRLFDRQIIAEMLEGFADAAVRADDDALPSVRVVYYVAKGTPGSPANASDWRRRARNVVEPRLGDYWSDEEYVEHVTNRLLQQVSVQAIEVPVGDARGGTVHVDVDGQRPPGGMYGPETSYHVDDPDWGWVEALLYARQALAGVDRGDAIFTQARALLNKYSEEPARFIGLATELQRLHEARYEAAVEILAREIRDNPDNPDNPVSSFEFLASRLADSVGLRRRRGVVGGESVPGGLVPLGVGVGRVRAGVVVGKLGSLVGRAARWLRREPGAFAVVVPGHQVPDADSVEAAVRAAGWNGSDTLRLFLCAQDGLAELAAELAERLQVRVSYAKGWVWLGMNPARWGGARPAAQVAKIEYAEDGSPLFTLRDDGTGWADKNPGGTEDEDGTPYLQTAPEQAPRLGLEQMIHLGPQAPALDPAPAKPLVPGNLVGWRPKKDKSGPRNLRGYLREHLLLRGIAPWLGDVDPGSSLPSKELELLLANPSFEQLPPKLKTMVRRLADRDMAQQLKPGKARMKGEAESSLFRTRLGNLPRELLDMVWNEAERELFKSAEAWFVHILNELNPDGLGFRYSAGSVARKSGGLVDAWVVEQLRGVARASWQARLNDSGDLSLFDDGVVTEMLHGFVDAAVLAESEALPSVRVVHYIAEGTPGTWADDLRLGVQHLIRERLAQYPLDAAAAAAAVDGFFKKVSVQSIEVQPGDERIGTVHFDVDGQRPPGGLYGPGAWVDPDDPAWDFHRHLADARPWLDGMDRGDAVFTLARALLNRYSEEPLQQFIGPADLPQRLHEARYEAAVEILAATIVVGPDDAEVAEYDDLASMLADSVGPRRRHGVLGGSGRVSSEAANTVEDIAGAEPPADEMAAILADSVGLRSQEGEAGQGAREGADPPQDRAPGTETPAQPGASPTIPRYFRRAKAPGISTQLSQTEQVDRVVESARSFAPKPPTAAELADLEHAFANDAASFFGEGRVFTMGGRPVRIRVDRLHWSKQDAASRAGAAKAATRESAVKIGASAGTENDPRVAFVFFTPIVPGMFGTGVVSASSNVATSRRHGHDLGGSKLVSVSLPERPTRSVKVPMTVLVEPEEPRSDDGKLNVKLPAAAEFSIPEGLGEEGRAVSMPDALPPSATEAVTVKRGSARKIFEQVLVRLGKLDKNSREVLREFLGTGSITAHLAGMAVSPHADAEAGWVTSPTLVRGGNPIKRILSSRSQKVQMRAVAREVAYLETIEDAEFREHEVVSSSKNASSTAGRHARFYFAGGPGFDYGLVTAGGGPGIGAGYRKSRTSEIDQNSDLSVTRTYKDTVVRYRTVYDLQVRTPGRATITFVGGAEGTQWAQLDDARRAGLLPDENAGTAGRAQLGAPLQLSEASDRLKKIMHDSAKVLPKHDRTLRDAGLVTRFDDPKLKKGLSGKLERQVARSEAIDSAMSEDNLARRLPALLSERSQFLELAAEPGWGHDYRTGFQLDARLLAPLGESLGPVKGGAGTSTVNDVDRVGDTVETDMDLTAGFRARVYGRLAASTALLSYTFKFFANRTRATERARGTQLGAGGTAGRELDESGSVVPEPKYRYAAKVELEVSGSHYSRYNELARGLTFAKWGKHVPDRLGLPIIDSQAAADGRAPGTIIADVVLELTKAERDALESVSETKGTSLPPKPLNDADYLRTGTSRVLDGIPVLAVSGLDQVRNWVRTMLRGASGDPIWTFRDGDNSALIEHAISVEALRSDPRAFNRPTRIDGLRWKRRKATATAAVGVGYRLRDPEVLETIWQQPRPSAGATTSTSAEKGWEMGVANELEPAAMGVSEGSAHPEGSVMHGVVPVLVDWKFWRFTFRKTKSRKTSVMTTTTQNLEPGRVHVVKATLGATVSVETGRRGQVDRWHFRRTRPPKTAAYRLDRAGVVWVLLTDEQLHEVRIQQAAEDARRGIEGPAYAPEPAERIEGVPEGHTLGGSNWADGISEPVDLSGSLYQADEPDIKGDSAGLYERLEKALTKEEVDQLRNSPASDTGHDNHRAIEQFLSDFQASMPDVANGGVSAGLRLENRVTGANYDLIVEARPKSAPKPVGVVHGRLTKVTVGSAWAATTRTVSRTVLEMLTNPGVGMMFQSESEAQEAQREPGKHGAPAGTLGYAVGHIVEWLNQFRSRTNARTANLTQTETVNGALAERSVELDFDIRFERHGERIAGIAAERTVRTRSAIEDQGTGDGELSRGTVTRRLETEATEDRIGEWRKAAGAARLPDDPADFRIVHFDGEVGTLRDAAREVLEELLGKKLDSRTWAMVRDQITPSQLKALAPSHFGNGSASSLPAEAALPEKDGSTGTELVLPSELGVKLTLHAMLDGPGSLEGASGRITLSGHTDVTRDKEFSGGSETANGLLTLPVFGAGVPQAPGHTTYEEGRRLFGGASALFFGLEPHGGIAGGHEYQGAVTSGGQALAVPGAPAAPDPVTATFSYPTRFRLVAEPLSTGPLARRTTQVADVDYDKGFHVRRKDQNHRLPTFLKTRAIAMAVRDWEWTKVREKARALAAKNPSAVHAAAFERRAADKFWRAKRAYDHALVVAQANPALHGGQRFVRLEIPPGAQGVPVEYWPPLAKVVRHLLAAHEDGRTPRVRYRVIGEPAAAVRDFTDLVMPRLDLFADLLQVSVPPQERLGRYQLGLATTPEVVPGTGASVIEIWIDENEDRLPVVVEAAADHLHTIWEEDEPDSDSDSATVVDGGEWGFSSESTYVDHPLSPPESGSFRAALPEYARDGEALGLVVVTEVKDREKVGKTIKELLAPFGTAEPEGVKAIEGKLNRARFETFLGTKPVTYQPARGGRSFQVRVGEKWFEVHVTAVMDLDGATPGEGKPEPSRAVRELREQQVFGHSQSNAENSSYRLGASSVSMTSAGVPVIAGGGVELARPVGVRTKDTSSNAQTIWRPHSEAQSAKAPVKYYITITGEDGGGVTEGTADGEVGLLLSDSVGKITKPDGVSAGKPNPGWEKRMGYVAVDAVLFDERALFDKLRRKLHPSVTKLQAPGWAALREFVSSANIRALSRRMWRGETATSPDLVSPHGAYREAARMDFRPQDVEFVGVVPDEGESRIQDTVTDEESVAYTTKTGPDVLFGVGYGAGLPNVAAVYGGGIGNVNAGLSDTAVGGRSVTTGTSMRVRKDVGLYRVTGEVEAETSHGERVKEPATKYVRLDLHEAAAENLPVPPGYEKRFVDVGPRYEPPYLAAAAAGGHIRAGVTLVAEDVLPRIENALRRVPGLEDLLPKWSSKEDETVRGSGDKMERRLSNQRKLASVFSATPLMNRLDSLFGPGVSTQLKHRGVFFDEFISVRVKAKVDKGRHLGQVDGRTVVGIETTGAAQADSAGMGHGLSLGPEARGRVGPGGSDIDGTVNAAVSPVKFSVGRSVKNAGGSGSAVTVEQVGDGHAQVFAHGITFEIEIVSHRRPRRWVRRLTPGSPLRSIPKLRFLAGSRPGAEVHIAPETGKTELWVNDSAVYETDPSEFAPEPTTVVHLDPEETPSIDELAESTTRAPEFLYVEAFANAGELGELAVELSNRATNDDEVLVLPGSKGHQAVHQWFAPETLRALLKPSSKPAFRRNGLSYGRRATKRIGALGMQLELTEPVVVKISDVSRDKKTFSGTTKAASEHVRLKGFGPGASLSLFAPEPTATETAAGRLALSGSAKFWGRKRVGASEQTIKAEHKGKSSDHSRTVLVRYDVRSRMVAESRLKGVVDGAVSVAGADKFMPGSLFVRMSERQARAQGLLPPAEPRAAVPGLGAPELAFGSSGSLGAYVTEDLPDLSSLLPALRAGLKGEHRDLIPESVLEDPMGTAERLGELVDDTNAASLLDNALDGGLPLRVHKPGTLWSDDYNVVLKATVETVEFDGYVNDGGEIEQTLADATPGKSVEERSRSWGGLFRLGWRSLFPTSVHNSQGALGGSAGLSGTRERTDRRVAGSGLTSIRATTGSGPGARYRVGLKWELKIEREGREVASSAVSDHITIRTNADDQQVGRAGGPAHRSVTVPFEQYTEDSVKEWQKVGVTLPAGVRVEGFRGAADIRDGAVRAIKSAGAKAGLTGSETGAMNTLALSVTNSGIRANLGKTSAGSLPLPELYSMSLIGGQVAKVKIYSRLSGAQIAGLSDDVRFDQSATNLDSFTADTAHSGSSGTTRVGGDGGIVDRAGSLHMPGGAGPQSATASGRLSGATAGLRSVTVQDTGRSGLTRFDTEHLIVADVDGVTSAVVVQLPASALPRAINADLATVLGTPLPEAVAHAQDGVSRAGALWRAKETILHRKQGAADQKWFAQRAAEQRIRDVAGVPGEKRLDPRDAAQRARIVADVAALKGTGTRDAARGLAARLAQEEARLDMAIEELAEARAELTEAARAADVALGGWLRAKEALEAELAKVNAGLRPPLSLPGRVRDKAAWARELLEKRRVSDLAGLMDDARQTLSAHFPELDDTAELWEILHTILTAERVHYQLKGETAASAKHLLDVLAQTLAESVVVPEASRVGARETRLPLTSTTFDPDVGRARVTFDGRLGSQDRLTADDRLTITLMVQGLVDAAVAARPGEEPSLVGGVYVSPDTPAAVAERVVSFVKAAAWARLNAYPPGARRISAEELMGLIRVSAREPFSEGSPAGAVQLQVRGRQRPVKGLFGPEVFTDPANPLPHRAAELRQAREALIWFAGSDPVLVRARAIVNRHNQAPRPSVESAAWVDRAHRARYRAAVDLVALELLRDSSERAADALARALVSEVMWPREPKGVPGGAPLIQGEPSQTGESSTAPQDGGEADSLEWSWDEVPLPSRAKRTKTGTEDGQSVVSFSENELFGAVGGEFDDFVAGWWEEAVESGSVAETSEEVAPRQGRWSEKKLDDFWEDAPKWRPEPGGPKTFRAFLDGQPLPHYIIFESRDGSGKRVQRSSGSTELLVRMWVAGQYGEVEDPEEVAGRSGGLIDANGVKEVWEVFERQKNLVDPLPRQDKWDEEELDDFWKNAPQWRRGQGEAETFWEFLSGRNIPDHIFFGPKDGSGRRVWASSSAELLVRMWVEGLYEEVEDPEEVARLSGGLIDADGVRVMWMVFGKQGWTKEDLADFRFRVRRWPRGAGKTDTLRALFEKIESEMGSLPQRLRINVGKSTRSTPGAKLLIRAWAEGLYGARYKPEQVAEISDGLIDLERVVQAWKSIAAQKRMEDFALRPREWEADGLKKFLIEARKWRPGDRQVEKFPNFLKGVDLAKGLPWDIVFGSDGNSGQTHMPSPGLTILMRAWAEGLFGKGHGPQEVAKMSDDLIHNSDISKVWNSIKERVKQEGRGSAPSSAEGNTSGEVPGDVVRWSRQQGLRVFLESHPQKPTDFLLKPVPEPKRKRKRKAGPEQAPVPAPEPKSAKHHSTPVALSWLRAWAAWLFYEKELSGAEYTMYTVAKMSEGLLTEKQVKDLWSLLESGTPLPELKKVGKSGILESRWREYEEHRRNRAGSVPEQGAMGAGLSVVEDAPQGLPGAAASWDKAEVGVLVGRGDPALRRAAGLLPKESRMSGDDVFGVVLLDHGMRDPDVVERAIRDSGWQKGQPIRLYACEDGGALKELAIELRRRLGVAVGYPAGLLWLGVPGRGRAVRVGGIDEDGKPLLLPGAEDGAGWIWLGKSTAQNPQGVYLGHLKYELDPPSEEPTLGLTEERHLGPHATYSAPFGIGDPVAAAEQPNWDDFFDLVEYGAEIELGYGVGDVTPSLSVEGADAPFSPGSSVPREGNRDERPRPGLVPLPEKVLNWCPGEGGVHKLRELLEDLRQRGELLPGDDASGWINSWVAAQRGKGLTPLRVAGMSGGLITNQQVKALWKALEDGKSFAELGIAYCDPRSADVGVLVGYGDPDLRQAAGLLPKENSVFGVVLLDHWMRDLDLIEQAIRDSGWRVGEAIRLYAHKAGGDLDKLARGLRERLGVAVGYPAGELWLGMRGPGVAVQVSGITPDGVPYLPDASGYGWLWRVDPSWEAPQGLIGETYYPLSVSDEAPAALGLGKPRHLGPRGAGIPPHGEGIPAKVLNWRPGDDGMYTLRAFLEFMKRNGELVPGDALGWVKAWAVRLYFGTRTASGKGILSQVDILRMSGGAISSAILSRLVRGIVAGTKSFAELGIAEPDEPVGPVSEAWLDVPDEVVNWLPGDDGPQTLYAYLNSRKPHPAFVFNQEIVASNGPALRWIRAWAAAQRGKGLPQLRVAEMSGGLINNWQVGRLWQAIESGKSFEELGIAYCAPRCADVGALVGYGDPDLRQAAELLPKENSVFGDVFGVVLLDHWMRDLDLIERAIRDSGWQGQSIRLYAHKAGGDLDKLARGLRERLGVAVGYPAGELWLGMRGPGVAVQVSGTTPDGMPYLPDASGRGWLWRVGAQGLLEGSRYPLPVPDKAPDALGLEKPRHLGPRIAGIPAKVLNWRPGDDGTYTLRAFLKFMEQEGELVPQDASGWVKAWAVRLYYGTKTSSGRLILTRSDVVRMSGGLISEFTLKVLVCDVDEGERSFVDLGIAEPDEPVAPASDAWLDAPDDVVNWSPGRDGPQTLHDYLIGKEPHTGFAFIRGRTGSNGPALGWINAWVAAQRGKGTPVEVAVRSGFLIRSTQVDGLWQGLEEGKSFAELEIAYCAPRPADVGVLVGHGDPDLKRAAGLLPKEADVFGVVLLDHWMRDPDLIERAIRDSGWQGQPIRLYAHKIGDDLEKLARDLHERLGVPVGYPEDTLWLGMRGPGVAVRVGASDEDGEPSMHLVAAGGERWIWVGASTAHSPPGSYKLYAPQEPLVLGLTEPRHLGPRGAQGLSSDVQGIGIGQQGQPMTRSPGRVSPAGAPSPTSESSGRVEDVSDSESASEADSDVAVSVPARRKRTRDGALPVRQTKRAKRELVPIPKDVLIWRPGMEVPGRPKKPGEPAPLDLNEYLLARGLPPGFELKSDKRSMSNELARGWIYAWAARLLKLGEPGKGLGDAEIEKMSGGLINRRTIGDLRRRFDEKMRKGIDKEAAFAELGIAEPVEQVGNVPETWADVPDDVVEWRPGTHMSGVRNPDGSLPGSLEEYLKARGNLPGKIAWKSGKGAKFKSDRIILSWVRAWAAGMRGEISSTTKKPLAQKKVAALSGTLMYQDDISVLWRGLDKGETFEKLGISNTARLSPGVKGLVPRSVPGPAAAPGIPAGGGVARGDPPGSRRRRRRRSAGRGRRPSEPKASRTT
ncbi:hypothetical protein, partial [Amycolatopsis japonica]